VRRRKYHKEKVFAVREIEKKDRDTMRYESFPTKEYMVPLSVS
jgi:hypothetical protein